VQTIRQLDANNGFEAVGFAMRIVLAEDNPADVFLLREALKEHGVDAEVHWIDDGAEALNYFDTLDLDAPGSIPDAILLDLTLPKVDGEVILRRIRDDDRYWHVPVAVMSSANNPMDRERAQALGASFICKPADLDEFLQIGGIVCEMCKLWLFRQTLYFGCD
jgi:DNA-binding response OmpR family regulator